jgi:hypothetical protein
VIDLWFVASNSLWIAGLSLLLATISWASWAASVEGARMGTLLARRGARRAWSLGLALFSSGLAATGRAWWERALWGALAIAFLASALTPGQGRPPSRLTQAARRSSQDVDRLTNK